MRLTNRIFAVAAFALAASQFQVGTAHACIKYDRGAEMALIDEAIGSSKTSDPDKAVLRALRKEIFVYRNKKSFTSDDFLQHHYLSTEALKMIGKERIVWVAPDDTDPRQLTKSAKGKAAAAAAPTSCG